MTARRTFLAAAAVMLLCIAGLSPVRAGCCTSAPSGKGVVFSRGQTDKKACENTGGELTTLEDCAARQGKGKVVIID